MLVSLREIQFTDVDLLLKWENNPDNWQISDTVAPFSRKQIEGFVNQQQSLKDNTQQRFIVCLDGQPIGCIDLFEYDESASKAGVGVLIAQKKDRNKGYASVALNLLIDKCRNELNVVHLFCNIYKENKTSIRLFENCGFQFVDERKLDGKPVNYYELKND
ncbi:MAG: GNAT family protein [Vicingaceae bacterium]|nr:GNAT family protein [Vicingaceae bacterium]